MPVRGPDVSNNQALPNWRKVRSGGFFFAGAKATEGLTFNDPHFAANWRGMKDAGLIRIAYHYAHADPGRSAVAEAQHFLNFVRDCGGWQPGDIPALDIEAGALSGAALDRWVNDFCREVEKHWRSGLIYSGAWYLGERGAKLVQPRKRGWKLWSSAYGAKPTLFSGFADWLLWQFTDGIYGPQPHRVPGVGSCDVSIFNGTLTELLDFAHAGALKKVRSASRVLHEGASGTDVAALQHALNHRLVARGRHAIPTDGDYGKSTAEAVHFVTYSLGFPLGTVKRTDCSPREQLLIIDPHKRPASYLAAALYRAGRRAA